MAYAVLSSLAQTIHQILDYDQYPISDNRKHQITSLRQNVVFLQEFLKMFPKEATCLEIRIRDAANEAEDILEHFMYNQIQSIRSDSGSTTNNSCDCFDELKKAMVEINSISRMAADVKSLNTTKNVVVGDSPPTVPYAVGGVTVGLHDDVLKITDLLTRETSELHTISIAGMGGIGKSTLAMNAYNDQLIMETFTVRAWVTVSQEYKAEDILSVLVDSFKEFGDVRAGETVMEKVYKFLFGRKYLIALDDIWSKQAWDDVKNAFPKGGDGSRIILTTRLRDVASHASPLNYVHQMSFMDGSKSWDLLKQKVFAEESCPSELKDVGMDIARNCGGLPLAIVLVAGILSTVDKTRFSWLEVAKKVRSCVDGEDGQFEKVISLSYTHLPHHLRACFLYMGGFPNDSKISVSKLIKLWIAEGFVEPTSGKSHEECAEEYLEDLVKRNLALVRQRKSNGKIKRCNVHDLVHDICKRKTEEENLQRRLSIAHPDLMLLARAYASTLRSVICFHHPSETSLGALKLFKLLRVLDFVHAIFDSFPAQVLDLFHLRYLGFTFSGGAMEIPAALSRLQNLRSLIISATTSSNVVHLPFEIWMVPLLRHLISSIPLLLNPEGDATSKKLETLNVVTRFACSKQMIEMIPNIKKLGIIYHHDDEGDYELHNLVLLHHLEKLKLDGSFQASQKMNPVFPNTLKKLTLSGCRFPWEYMETVGSLPNLQVLKLKHNACEGDTWETMDDQFPSLKYLYINSNDLENLVTESSHFPRLKHLVFFNCDRLREIPDDIGDITTLQLIEVSYLNFSLLKCARRIQEQQRENGNYDLQVHIKYPEMRKIPISKTSKLSSSMLGAIKNAAAQMPQMTPTTAEKRDLLKIYLEHEYAALPPCEVYPTYEESIVSNEDDSVEDASPRGSSSSETEEYAMDLIHTLVQNKQCFEHEYAALPPCEVYPIYEESIVSNEDDSVEDASLKGRSSSETEEYAMDLIHRDVIPQIKSIADMMFASGYAPEFCQAFTGFWRDTFAQYSMILEVGQLSIEDVQHMEWKHLNSRIRKWRIAVKRIIGTYLASAKRLFDQILGEYGCISSACLIDASKGPLLCLLSFGQAVSIGPHRPEWLYCLLDMYEVLAAVNPELDTLEMDTLIRIEFHELLSQVGESVKVIIKQLGNCIASNRSANPFPNGGILPLTRYMVNYILCFAEYGDTLHSLLQAPDREQTDGDVGADPDPSPSSVVATYLQSLTSILEDNLYKRSNLYRDCSLKHIFFMNNIHYMVEKIRNSDVRPYFGDDWIRIHLVKFRQHAMYYERETWLSILTYLHDDGKVGKAALKARCRDFTAAFEDLYKTQTRWLVPDAKLREDVRISASKTVIQAYRNFVDKIIKSIGEKHIKYSEQELEMYIWDLLEGSSKSLNHSRKR